MIIFGIDPGYERLGIAIVEKNHPQNTEKLIHSECLKTPAKDPFEKRLSVIGNHIDKLIKKHSPTDMAIENLFFNTNQKTAMRVAEVRGALIYIASLHSVKVFEYTPPQVKAAITGSGRSNKQDMAHMLHNLLNIPKDIHSDDELDAIAIALTHSAYTG